MTRREALRRITALNVCGLSWLAGLGRGHADINGLKAPPARPGRAAGLADAAALIEPPGGAGLRRGLRVMVFAPHPDDETIAAGGLLQLLRASRGTARVVFVTSGDGYAEGAAHHFGRRDLVPSDYIEYGRIRCREALQAMKSLGVRSGKIDFLGFPDAGISALLSSHWMADPAYVSPHTRVSRPPYAECRDTDAAYTGTGLAKPSLTRSPGSHPTGSSCPIPGTVIRTTGWQVCWC